MKQRSGVYSFLAPFGFSDPDNQAYREDMESASAVSSMNSRERYTVSNEDPFDEKDCSSDDQSDRREQEYDDVDGPNSRPSPNTGGPYYSLFEKILLYFYAYIFMRKYFFE